MRLKFDFVFEQVGSVVLGVVVGLDEYRYKHFLRLNELSYDIVKHLKYDCSEQELINKFLSEYDVEVDVAKITIDCVLKSLRESGVIES